VGSVPRLGVAMNVGRSRPPDFTSSSSGTGVPPVVRPESENRRGAASEENDPAPPRR